MKMKGYPKIAFKSKRKWLKDVRKRWFKFRPLFSNDNNIRLGCAYYPDEVSKWISKFEKMDDLMKEYYKNA